MENPHLLQVSAIACQDAFRQCLSVPSLNHESWTENRLGDFNLWLTNLRVLKPGHASLDYRLRDREDLRNVIEGLLRTLYEFVERCRKTEEPTINHSVHEAPGCDGSDSSWSDISDEENEPSRKKPISASILSDPVSGVESTLDRLIRLGMVIRKSGDRFRHELADRSLEVANYEDFKIHLEFVLLNEQISGQESEATSTEESGNLSGNTIPFATRQRLLGEVKLTDFQKRAIHANMIRRNRFEFAKKRELRANPHPQPKQPPPQKPTAPTPKLTPKSKGPEGKSKTSISRPSIVETATKVGTITTPVEPTPSKAETRTTKMSSTGQRLDYPRCPPLESPDDASFQCPFCCQQLPRKYLEKSRWRSHVHGDIMPYICIFEGCPGQQIFFGSKEEWLQHLRATHSKEYWQCPFPDICKNTPECRFATESDWIDHMATHQISDAQANFSTAQLRIVAGTNIVHDFSIESCPLCSFSSPINEEETIKHIAEHLHSFALRSLPWESCVNEDQSAVTQAMDGKVLSDFSDDSRELFESEDQTVATPENDDRFRHVIADWQAIVFDTKLPPSYTTKLAQVGNAAGMLCSSESGDEGPTDWAARRRMETGLLDISWIIQQLEELMTPSGGLRYENMAEIRDDLEKDFEDLVSALRLPAAGSSEEKSSFERLKENFKELRQKETSDAGGTSWANPTELAAGLTLPTEMKKDTQLSLVDIGSEIIFEGDLQQQKADAKYLVDTHAILFNNYLVLANGLIAKDQPPFELLPNQPTTTKQDMHPYGKYDVSRPPIPMDLLVLESTNDHPVARSCLGGVPPVTLEGDVSLLTHTGDGPSMTSCDEVPKTKDEKILFPFNIKHLGKSGTYTLYAFSAQGRMDWCQKIIEAKTRHDAAFLIQELVPFRLRVLADTAFGYPAHINTSGSKGTTIKGSPLHRAIMEVKINERFEPRPELVCMTSVNCATTFQHPQGRQMCAVGTGNGVYMSGLSNPRGWYRAIPIMRVTQVAVFEKYNMILLIADRSLIAYHLDIVCPASEAASWSHRPPRPQRLSGNRDVEFFAAGRLQDRDLVLYEKRDGLSSIFKVLEHKPQNSSSGTSRFLQSRRSETEFFREYDDFYIPDETYGINMFQSSLAISTRHGIEVLTLDKKHAWSVPDFSSATTDDSDILTSMARLVKDLRPLGMFRISDSEFLIAYQQCAVYVNKHGDVSRSVVMEFLGSAHTACLCGNFLVLLHDDFVQVRNAMNGRLRQIIPGHNVVCLDDGSKQSESSDSIDSSQHTVKICMQHPELVRTQLVLELVADPDVIA